MITEEQRLEYFRQHTSEVGDLMLDLVAKGISLKDATEEVERYIDERLGKLQKLNPSKTGASHDSASQGGSLHRKNQGRTLRAL